MTLVLRLLSPLIGRRVGTDRFGNAYYAGKPFRGGHGAERRWVVYKGEDEATAVPPEWHGWLHNMTPQPLPEAPKYGWMVPYEPNDTGTPRAYRPSGHDYAGGRQNMSGGDYDAWAPGGEGEAEPEGGRTPQRAASGPGPRL